MLNSSSTHNCLLLTSQSPDVSAILLFTRAVIQSAQVYANTLNKLHYNFTLICYKGKDSIHVKAGPVQGMAKYTIIKKCSKCKYIDIIESEKQIWQVANVCLMVLLLLLEYYHFRPQKLLFPQFIHSFCCPAPPTKFVVCHHIWYLVCLVFARAT